MKAWVSTTVAVSGGISGWFLAASPYILKIGENWQWHVLVSISSIFVWSCLYFLLQPFTMQRSVWTRVLLSTATYILVGVFAVATASAWRQFSGGFVLVPFWPFGVSFIIFGETVYDPQDPVNLFLLASLATAVLGVITGIVHSLLVRRETAQQERQPSIDQIGTK